MLLAPGGSAGAQRCRYPYGRTAKHAKGSSAKSLVGQTAPEIRVKGFDGREHTLGEYRGKLNKVVLLHFTDPAAPGAYDAAADLESLYRDVDHWDVTVVLVAQGQGGDPYHEAQM